MPNGPAIRRGGKNQTSVRVAKDEDSEKLKGKLGRYGRHGV